MSGKAIQGSDYTLDGTPGQVTIPIGQDSAAVTLHALTDSLTKEKSETATMTLRAGSSYSFGGTPPPTGGKKKKKTKPTKPPSATTTIINVK